MERDITQQFFEQIEKANNIVIAVSELPTVEATAAAVALRLFLESKGKTVRLSSAGEVPGGLTFSKQPVVFEPLRTQSANIVVELSTANTQLDELSYAAEGDKVRIFLKAKQGSFSPSDITVQADQAAKPDAIITVGASSLDDLGSLFRDNAELFYEVPKIAIDTQARSEYFGAVNVIDVTASSNGELLQNVFMLEQGAAPIQPEVATWLLASIVAATNSFQDVRTTPRTLAASAKLIELGARQQDIIVSLFKTRDFALLKLWGRVLARIKTVSDQFLYSTLSSTDFTKTNTTAVHVLPALRELLDNISGYQVVVLLAETEPGSMTAVLATLPHVQTREFVGILASGEIREVQNHGAYRVQQFAIAAKDIVEAESKVVAAAPELNQK